MVEPWEKSNDEFLQELASGHLDEGVIPTMEEAATVLRFLSMFATKTAEIGLEEISERFRRRADLYVVVLQRMGYTGGWRSTGKWSRDRGTLDKIILWASGSMDFNW